MQTFVLIGAGGFLGANLRYAISVWAAGRYGTAFPAGTLIANLAGSFLIGLVLGLIDDAEMRLLLATGVLGAETTFSTFSYETIALLRQGDWRRAALNIAGSTLLGLVAVVLGMAAAHLLGATW